MNGKEGGGVKGGKVEDVVGGRVSEMRLSWFIVSSVVVVWRVSVSVVGEEWVVKGVGCEVRVVDMEVRFRLVGDGWRVVSIEWMGGVVGLEVMVCGVEMEKIVGVRIGMVGDVGEVIGVGSGVFMGVCEVRDVFGGRKVE